MRYHIEIEGEAGRTLTTLPVPTRTKVIGELRFLAQTEGERSDAFWCRLAGLPDEVHVTVDGYVLSYVRDEDARVLRVRALVPAGPANPDMHHA